MIKDMLWKVLKKRFADPQKSTNGHPSLGMLQLFDDTGSFVCRSARKVIITSKHSRNGEVSHRCTTLPLHFHPSEKTCLSRQLENV